MFFAWSLKVPTTLRSPLSSNSVRSRRATTQSSYRKPPLTNRAQIATYLVQTDSQRSASPDELH